MRQDGETEGLCGGPGQTALCGNGLQDDGEECDDGNAVAGDACTPECKLPKCGDGFVEMDEACIDMVACDGDDGCRADLGPGWVCGAAALCVPVTPHARCTDTYPQDLLTSPDKYHDAIVFGSLLDHTPIIGDEVMVAAANLAILQVNQSGLGGRMFGIVHCDYREDGAIDTKTSEQAVVETARYLIDTLGTPAIIGPGSSLLTTTVFPELLDPPTLVISPSASSDSLTSIDVEKPGLVWRTTPPNSALGDAMAVRMGEEGVTQAHVIHASDPYSLQIKASLGSFGGSLDFYQYDKPSGIFEAAQRIDMEHDPAPGLAVVFIGSDNEQVTLFLQATNGLDLYKDDRVLLFFSDSAYDNRTIDAVEEFAASLIGRIRVAFPYDDTRGPAFSGFSAALLAEFSIRATDSSYSAKTYDATWLAIYGAAWAHYQRGGALDGRGLAYGLLQISDGLASETTGCAFPVTEYTWPIVKACFKDGTAIDVRGASGNLNYDPVTEELKSGAAHIYSIEDHGDTNGPDFECLDCDD